MLALAPGAARRAPFDTTDIETGGGVDVPDAGTPPDRDVEARVEMAVMPMARAAWAAWDAPRAVDRCRAAASSGWATRTPTGDGQGPTCATGATGTEPETGAKIEAGTDAWTSCTSFPVPAPPTVVVAAAAPATGEAEVPVMFRLEVVGLRGVPNPLMAATGGI